MSSNLLNSKKYIYTLLFLISIIYLAISQYLSIYIANIDFPDSKEYLSLRDYCVNNPFSIEKLLDGRSFSLQLFYYIIGNNQKIVLVQNILFHLSFIFLGLVLYYYHKKTILGILFFITTYVVSLNNNIYFWHQYLLSESITITLLNISTGLIILTIYYLKVSHKLNLMLFIPFICILFIFSNLRDTNFLITLSMVFILVAYLFKYKKHKFSILLILFISGCYFFQSYQASKNKRYKIPFMNIVGTRILTNEKLSNYFLPKIKHDSCIFLYKGKMHYEDWEHLYCFGDFRKEETYKMYLKYILSNPTYFFGLNKDEFNDVFFSNTKTEIISNPTVDKVLEIFKNSIKTNKGVLLLCVICFFIFIIFYTKHRDNYAILISIIYGFTILLYGLFCFHGDSLEVNRHCLLAKYGIYFLPCFIYYYVFKLSSIKFFPK